MENVINRGSLGFHGTYKVLGHLHLLKKEGRLHWPKIQPGSKQETGLKGGDSAILSIRGTKPGDLSFA